MKSTSKSRNVCPPSSAHVYTPSLDTLCLSMASEVISDHFTMGMHIPRPIYSCICLHIGMHSVHYCRETFCSDIAYYRPENLVSPYVACSSIFTRTQDTVIGINITVLALPSSDTSTVVVTDTTL